MDISDVASLKQAANLRLLYVEYERNGELVRGQFWPKTTGDKRLSLADLPVDRASSRLRRSIRPPNDWIRLP